MRRGSTTSRRYAAIRTGCAVLAILVSATSLVSAARQRRRRAVPRITRPIFDAGRPQVGNASWYGPGFHGRRTASGERPGARKETCMSA